VSTSCNSALIASENHGNKLPIAEQQKLWLEEYHKLTEDQKKDLVVRYDAKIAEQPKTRRPDARGRAQDVTKTITNVQNMVCTLYHCVPNSNLILVSLSAFDSESVLRLY
jgi:hypothetical protein